MIRPTSLFILLPLLVVACGDGSSQDDADARTDVSSGPETTEPALTRISLSELADSGGSDVDRVLQFAEGGDNLCNSASGQPSEVRFIDNQYRQVAALQVGWVYSVCLGNGDRVDEVSVFDPNGTEVGADGLGPFPLVPGSPTGTYRIEGIADGEQVWTEVEVVDATDPRVLADAETAQGAPVEEARFHVVGFVGRSSVPIAVYDTETTIGELIGTFDVELDELGTGQIVILGAGAPGRCVNVVADTDLAIEAGSFLNGDTVILQIFNPLVARGCLA